MPLRDLKQRFDQEAPAWRDQYRTEAWQGPYNAKLFRREYVLELLGPGTGLCLDLGCGAGPFMEPLSRLGWRPVAFDFAPNMTALAQKEAFSLGAPGAVRGRLHRAAFRPGIGSCRHQRGANRIPTGRRRFLARML